MSKNIQYALREYRFTVYKPTEPGFQWLSVCCGPDGQVIAADGFDSQEEAAVASAATREIVAESARQRAKLAAGVVAH